ncbi:MAG: hypothetical protein J5497_07180, partial [Selenomonadaceae bacterium]|nr:hypothetical protein [Selenomonadaceae bacterium]
MVKRKIFIFFTYNIEHIGGTQMYTAGKANYLQQRGWQVYVFSKDSREAKSVIPSLTQYIRPGGGMGFLAAPPYKLKRYEQEFCLNEMLQRLQLISGEEHEIIIESHDNNLSCWAELLSAKVGARHFFMCCNEVYRPTPTLPSRTYGDDLDFFYFKWKRNEVVGDDEALRKLFNGYKNVTAYLSEMPWTIREMDAVQDVSFPSDKLEKLDWNICHIGRAAKEYVPFAVKGVAELAKRYPNKEINFVMVGNVNAKLPLLERTFQNLPNVFITLLGDMIPIPRVLFSKIDVVCAISQSARFAANEDVLTIVGNVNNPERTPGVLGYDTEEQVYGKGTFSYVEALENVLVKKLYAGKKYSLPKLRPANEYYDKFWEIVNNASPVKEYYTARLSQERIRDWAAIFPFGTVSRGSRIIFFGETEITKDYRRQIDSQKDSSTEFGREYIKAFVPCLYCQIV